MATTATASTGQYIALAKTLPAQLLRFFARYPPPQLRTPPPAAAAAGAAGEAPAPPPAPPTRFQLATKNPFFPQKQSRTGKWHNPVYSNRRQADLVKAARAHGLEALMPPSRKNPEARLAKKVALGSRVKGTGVGEKVKGHKHERLLGAKMDKRREAMLKMPALIREWKAVGRRNWTKWPK